MLDAERRAQVEQLTSGAFMAVSHSGATSSDDVRFFVAVARKILQRGTNPRVPDVLAPRTGAIDPDSVYAAALGPAHAGERSLDPSIKLDVTFEHPLWSSISLDFPGLDRFVIPQPSLEAMSGTSRGRGWADFVITAPWLEQPVVIELDGSQHTESAAIDFERDQSLIAAGMRVVRVDGPTALGAQSPVAAGLRWTQSTRPPLADADDIRAVHAPSAFTRTGIALLELLEGDVLSPGGDWVVDLEDDHGWAQEMLPSLLRLLHGVGLVWGLDVAPRTFTHGTSTLERFGDSYQTVKHQPGSPSARIVLEPFVPPFASLPAAALPTVVVRGAHVPGDLSWLPTPKVERRDLTGVSPDSVPPRVNAGLEIVLEHLFGFATFRDGQREAILDALSGRDSCVLLPTGAGKSLIYQVAGLLRPGVTLVVDPLVSLVDDQERRLHDVGITRVLGIHARKTAAADDRDAIYAAVAGGEALFVFHTPERLQSQGFRTALGEAVDLASVGLLVVDEAHCVSEWGHDFRTAYLRLGRNIRLLTRSGDDDRPPPLLALTGTASPAVLRDVRLELNDTAGHEMAVRKPATFDRPNLSYAIVESSADAWPADLRSALTSLIPDALDITTADMALSRGVDTNAGIVFVPHTNGRFGVQEVQAHVLNGLRPSRPDPDAFRVGIYSGSQPKNFSGNWDAEKVREASLFVDNTTTVLVSTKAFGMGIDKPNIRWTLHVGHPSSLEGFVQEAGRAGRDQRASHCVLLSIPPRRELSDLLLDVSRPRAARAAVFEQARKARSSDDITRQYFFLTSNYRGVEAELEPIHAVLEAIMRTKPGSRLTIPRVGTFGSEEGAAQEKALYRLSVAGVVDDYTIDYGTGSFTVDLAYFTATSIDQALLDYVTRVQPAATRRRAAEIATAPAGLGPRVEHHLKVFLETLYDVIEPARVRALTEMHLFATSGEDDDGLRRRILSYLSDGPLAGVFAEIGASQLIDVDRAIGQLDAVAADDPQEWIGAAARQLEVYPDQPILLAVRGLGEALRPAPDVDLVEASFSGTWAALLRYDVPGGDCAKLFAWLRSRLRESPSRHGGDLIGTLWRTWEESGLTDDLLLVAEQEVMARVAADDYHPAELNWILVRRLSRIANAIDKTPMLEEIPQ